MFGIAFRRGHRGNSPNSLGQSKITATDWWNLNQHTATPAGLVYDPNVGGAQAVPFHAGLLDPVTSLPSFTGSRDQSHGGAQGSPPISNRIFDFPTLG